MVEPNGKNIQNKTEILIFRRLTISEVESKSQCPSFGVEVLGGFILSHRTIF